MKSLNKLLTNNAIIIHGKSYYAGDKALNPSGIIVEFIEVYSDNSCSYKVGETIARASGNTAWVKLSPL